MTDNTFTVTTSKKWVLPPRPKPGRKPTTINNMNMLSSNLNLPNISNININPRFIPNNINLPNHSGAANNTTNKIPDTKNNRKRKNNDDLIQMIQEINKENYNLKNDLIKLIKDFKQLKESSIKIERPKTSDSINNTQQAVEEPNFKDLLDFIKLNDDDIMIDKDLIVEDDEFESDLETDDTLPCLTTTPSISTNSDCDEPILRLTNFKNQNIKSSIQVSSQKKIFNPEFDQDKYNYYNDLIEQNLIENNLNYYINQSVNFN